MLKEPDINKLLDEFDELKKQIRQKKQDLNKINTKKESWFKKKKDIASVIRDKINTLRSSKSKVTNLDKEVKQLKSTKNEVSDQIGKLISEVKELKKKYQDECIRKGITEKPYQVKSNIKKLEYTLETSALGFDQERKLTKEIKKLKKGFAQMSEVNKIWEVISKKEKDIDKLKSKKYGTLDKLREDSSQKYGVKEDFIANSQEIMDLRKQESEYYDNFLKLKNEFKKKSDELKELLNKKDKIGSKLKENNIEMKDEVVKAEKELIKEKSAEVDKKLKKREKLTTEDLLVFQSTNK